MFRRFLVLVATVLVGLWLGCGGRPCQELVKYYCEEKKDQQLCELYKDKVEKGMSKEACESTLRLAK